MGMIAVKKGKRSSEIRVLISKNSRTMLFSAGFMRHYGINKEKFKYLRLGYDSDIRAIGIEFLEKAKNPEECLKITYLNKGESGSVPINSLLSNFDLKIDEISGNYENKAIEGPVNIVGFTNRGYLLKVGMRSEVKGGKHGK
jgi:hypothetical protein